MTKRIRVGVTQKFLIGFAYPTVAPQFVDGLTLGNGSLLWNLIVDDK